MTEMRFTKNFARERIKNPKEFISSSFRTIKHRSGHDVIVGQLKGSKKWVLQAILHPKKEV
jgi:hypothetical protein